MAPAWDAMVNRSRTLPVQGTRKDSLTSRAAHATMQGAEIGKCRQSKPRCDIDGKAYADSPAGEATARLAAAGFDRNGRPLRPAKPSAPRMARTKAPKAPSTKRVPKAPSVTVARNLADDAALAIFMGAIHTDNERRSRETLRLNRIMT